MFNIKFHKNPPNSSWVPYMYLVYESQLTVHFIVMD
jgi:hypothetical protein